MIELKLTFATFEEAADAMLRLAGETVTVSAETATTITAAAEGKTEPAKRGRKPKAEKQADEQQNISSGAEDRVGPEDDAAEDTDEAKSDPAFASEDEAKAFFTEQVRPALSRYMAKHGQDAARKFLNDYADLKTVKLTDLPTEHYRAFVAACDA